ncbi:MAG TPA: biotin/lipoyl-binding protein, partial [Rhodothermales bacterium]|nr:biotin/lipoyl-binding protein [Rhodothermales bacterium]
MPDTPIQKSPIPEPKTAMNGSATHAAATSDTSTGGEGLDRKIRKKTWTPRRIALAAGVVLFVAFVGYGFATTTGGSRLNVEKDKVTIATVEQGPFQELINVTGNVMPRTTVYLDAVDGGRVEEVYLREGTMVKKGDPILRLSNSDLQLRLLQNEAAVTEQENLLQQQRLQMEENNLNLRQQLVQMDFEIIRLVRQNDRNRQLHDKKLISDAEFEKTNDELHYWQERRALTQQTYRTDSLAQTERVQQMQESINNMRRSFDLLQATLENLTLRAPVSGYLTSLDAEVGQIRQSGSRFGQIDVLDGGYKIRAGIDEYYISRVQRGQMARTTPINGQEYRLQVTRVYPEVRDGRFEVDMDFVGAVPEGIRRGQTIRFYLELSDPTEAVILPRGGFYQTTGGNWIYVVDESGSFATRRNIKIGRQNPNYYEVLEGLKPGEQVVTSSYETFGDAQRLE